MSYITFEDGGNSPSGKTRIVNVCGAGGMALGKVRWYGPWRGYCFFPTHGTVWSAGCLREVEGEIDRLMAERKTEAERGDGSWIPRVIEGRKE